MQKKAKKDIKINNLCLTDLQIQFLSLYPEHNFNINRTCMTIGITKSIVYKWLEMSKLFKDEFNKLSAYINHLIMSGFIEGITSDDLEIRAKYLAKIPQRILLKAFGEDTNEKLNIGIEYNIK